MSEIHKNWVWFIAILGLLFGGGLWLVKSRRADLGESFSYSLDEFRTVDPSLIHYRELDPIFPSIGNLSTLTFAPDGQLVIGGPGIISIFPGIGKEQPAPTQSVPMLGKELQAPTQSVEILGTPSCLAVDEAGIIFAGMGDHVEIFFAPTDRMVWVSPGPKAVLTSIAVDDEFVFVADAGSRCIWRYPKNGGEPVTLESDRKFFIPSPFFDLDLGPDGSLWVVNPGHHAFENIRSDDGSLISSWERTSMQINGFSGCCNPAHFSLLPDGAFVTAEKGLPRVKVHNLDGSLRCVVAAPDQFEDESIVDVAVDESGRVLVLMVDRIRIFEEKK